MAEDSEPLLGRASSEQRQDDATTFKEAPSLARFLGALSQGRLPDNNQLFTIFHKAASFLDGVSSSVSGSVDGTRANGSANGEHDADDVDIFSDDTALILATLLKESGALCRLMARWIYGEEAKEEQKLGKDETQGARGNEREQWQRLLWHLGRAFSLDTALPIGLDVEVPLDVQQAKEDVKEGARQLKKDTVASGRSVAQLISLIVSSDEFRRIPSDLIHFLRSSLADQVSDIGTRVDNVEDALRGPSGDGGGEAVPENKSKDFIEPDEALKETGKAVEAVFDGVKTGKGKEKEDGEEVDLEYAVRDQAVNRILRLLDTLQSNEQYHHAVNTLVGVSEKYLNLLDKATKDVSASLETAEGEDGVKKVQSLAADGVEKLQEEAKATIASTQLKSQVSAKVSHHFVEALKAAREVLEGLAGGRSLEMIVQKMERIKQDVEKDSALREWLGDVNAFLSRSVEGGKDASSMMDLNTEETKKELHSLYARLQALLHARPDILEAIDDLKATSRKFYADAVGDIALHRIRSRVGRIKQLATLTLWEGAQDVKTKGSQIVSMLINAVVPSIGDILGSVPIPRVEFTSDNIDAAVEDVVIPVVSLIPDTVRVTTMNDWEWKRNPRRKTTQSNIDTNLKISMRGLQLAITDISFYVQERFTAPSPASCFSCCSFGRSQSQWCFLQGPSSWLAYTESALLDVGFWRRGLGVTLDLSDAGQSEEKSAKKSKKKDQMWDDDTVSEGKRTHFFEVNKVEVQMDDSFDFKLRESRHWLINAMLRTASKPLVKLVLRRIISAQVQHGYEILDAKLWDYHYRAKRISLLRSEKVAKWEKIDIPSSGGLQRQDVHPALWDYVSVVLDSNAGKSKARIRLEQKQVEEAAAEKEAKQREEEEEAEERRVMSTQPKVSKTMEVKSTSIIKHDENGQYSLSVGLAPHLLNADQSGPKTKHIRLRDDLVQRNYKNLADRPKQKLINVYDEADLQGTVESAAEEVRKGVDLMTDVVEGTHATSRVIGQDEGDDNDDDQGWRSDAFSL